MKEAGGGPPAFMFSRVLGFHLVALASYNILLLLLGQAVVTSQTFLTCLGGQLWFA